MKWPIIHAIALLTVAAPFGDARAQTLPTWQIAEICAKESAPGQCAAFEGFAMKVVSSSWSFVVDATKESCLAQLVSPLDHSWRLLAECVDAEAFKMRDRNAIKTAKTSTEPVPLPKPGVPPPVPEAAVSPAAPAPTMPPKAQ
jgi:hypothetical protein